MLLWKILKIIGAILLSLGMLVILLGVGMIWYKEGFGAVQELYSPFNVINWLVTILTLAPGLILYQFSEKKITEHLAKAD